MISILRLVDKSVHEFITLKIVAEMDKEVTSENAEDIDGNALPASAIGDNLNPLFFLWHF